MHVKSTIILVGIIILTYSKVLVLVRIFPAHFFVQSEVRIGSGTEEKQVKRDNDITISNA